jgi:hypothetical protein
MGESGTPLINWENEAVRDMVFGSTLKSMWQRLTKIKRMSRQTDRDKIIAETIKLGEEAGNLNWILEFEARLPKQEE